MAEILGFVQRNVILFLMLGFVIGLIVFTEFRRLTRGFKEVSPGDAVQLINKQEALVLDVRETNELGQGKIIGAKHIEYSVLKDRVSEIESRRDKPIIVFCKTGLRAPLACKLLLKNQFKQVFNLKGGITGWLTAELPVVKK